MEKKLGITPGGSSSPPDPLAGKKHRLEDTEYIEQSKDIVENVKSAVSVGAYISQLFECAHLLTLGVAMLKKKKKKAKMAHNPPAEASSSAVASTIAAVSAVTDKVLESSPVAAATAAAVSVGSA